MPVKSAQEAWHRYAATGALSQKLLRPVVYRAWERSHLGGANPYRPKAEVLSSLGTLRLLESRHDLLLAGAPYLKLLSRAAGTERHAAMLGDAEGIVLDVEGDERSVQGPEAVPGPGALLSEAACGANGIGSPLAQGGYLELVGPEHFISGFHAFTCQGIPIRNPEGGLAGVVSTSVRRSVASRRLREILYCAARGMESELLRARLERDLGQVLVQSRPGAERLEALRQDVVQSQATARIQLTSAARRSAQQLDAQAHKLIHQAQQAIDRFEQRAKLWRLLASEEQHPFSGVELLPRLEGLLALMETEARIRQVSLGLAARVAPRIFLDEVALLRSLFRQLLEALEVASPGGAVQLVLAESETVPGGTRITTEAHPGPGSARSPQRWTLELGGGPRALQQ